MFMVVFLLFHILNTKKLTNYDKLALL